MKWLKSLGISLYACNIQAYMLGTIMAIIVFVGSRRCKLYKRPLFSDRVLVALCLRRTPIAISRPQVICPLQLRLARLRVTSSIGFTLLHCVVIIADDLGNIYRSSQNTRNLFMTVISNSTPHIISNSVAGIPTVRRTETAVLMLCSLRLDRTIDQSCESDRPARHLAISVCHCVSFTFTRH